MHTTDPIQTETACSLSLPATIPNDEKGPFPAGETEKREEKNEVKEQSEADKELLQSLSRLAKGLDSTVKEVEAPFLQLGGDLQAVYGNATDLTQHTLDTVKLLGTESETGILTRLDLLISDSLAALDASHSTADTDLRLIDTVVGDLRRLYNLCDTAEEIAKFLQMIGFNILIQSSGSQQFTQMFSFIARESKEFSKKIFQIAGNVRDDARKAILDQESIHGLVDDNLVELRKLADDARLLVGNAFEEIEKIITFSSTTLARANTYSSEISCQIGEIVMGIQLHDNINQRIEHIVQAIDEVEVSLIPGRESSEIKNNPEMEQKGYIASLLNLQIAQLQQVITEIESMHQKSRQAFASIGDIAEQLTDNLTTISSGSNNNSSSPSSQASAQDPFATLSDALFHLQELLGRGEDLTGQIQETTAHASQKVARFADHMEQIRQISDDTLLIALNAIINASHLGTKGAVFGVLAEELKDLSDHSNLFVKDVEAIIQGIMAAVSVDQSEGEAKKAGNDADCLKIAIEEISSTYSGFRNNCTAVSDGAGELQKALSRIASDLDFLPSLAKRLHDHLEKLQEIHHQLLAQIDPDVLLSPEAMERLAARYTMQQERDIHDQGTSSPKNQEEGEVLLFDQSSPADEDDCGDNFELF